MSWFRAGEQVLWSSAGSQNNPGLTFVMADTGPITTVGDYYAQIVISCDAVATFNIQWRLNDNSANQTITINGVANTAEQRVFFNQSGGGMAEFVVPFRVNKANERLRVVTNASVTGNACATILWQKMV